MGNDDIEIIGKKVKDMYGTFMGKVIGTITDIDGSIQTVGIDCGSQGLQQIPFEQLVVQGEVVIFIPKWRLDSQRLLREKGLTLRRLKALIDIVSENDEMKDDAEIIHHKYQSKLLSLQEAEEEIKTKLSTRISELDEQMKAVKTILFDAKVQFKSNEISDETFDTVKRHTTDLIEHITHETSEINSVQRRIADLEEEVQHTLSPEPKHLQDSAVTYLNNSRDDVESKLPEAPKENPVTMISSTHGEVSHKESESTPKVTSPTSDNKNDDSDWLSRMEAQ